jgi:hypothetical protein
VANGVSDGNAAHGSSASLVEVTKAIEQISPQAPNFAALISIKTYSEFPNDKIKQIKKDKLHTDRTLKNCACHPINLVRSCGSR